MWLYGLVRVPPNKETLNNPLQIQEHGKYMGYVVILQEKWQDDPAFWEV